MEGLCGFPATLDEVKKIPTPEKTNTWNPLGLGEFVEFTKDRLNASGMDIVRENYALKQTKGNDHPTQLFGIFNVKPLGGDDGDPRFSQSLGFRHCIDKMFGYNFVGGLNVFVCDNMEFFGTFDFNGGKAKKHSPNSPNELFVLLDDLLDKMNGKFKEHTEIVHRLENIVLTPEQASHLALGAVEKTGFPLTRLLDVMQEFRYPSFDYGCDPKSAWALQNAFTHVQKGRKAWDQMNGVELTNYFNYSTN